MYLCVPKVGRPIVVKFEPYELSVSEPFESETVWIVDNSDSFMPGPALLAFPTKEQALEYIRSKKQVVDLPDADDGFVVSGTSICIYDVKMP